jgi:hypothetical protein
MSRPLPVFAALSILVQAIALMSCGVVSASPQGLRITEFTYNSASGEFLELTNLGTTTLNLAGWSIDDVEAVPGAFDLTQGGLLAVGASIVITTEPAAQFRSAWGLTSGGVLGDNDTAKLSRTDTIHVFNPAGLVVDRLSFGDEVFEYTVRTLNVSAYVCPEAVGANDPYGWRRSVVADGQGSWTSAGGDVGSPGRHVSTSCAPLPLGAPHCNSAANSSGAIAGLEGQGNPIVSRNQFGLHAWSLPAHTVGYAIASLTAGFVAHPGGSEGNLCVGGTIARLAATAHGASASGVWDAPLDVAHVPHANAPIAPGETWYFQVWFRDSNPGPTSNFTSGVAVNFH